MNTKTIRIGSAPDNDYVVHSPVAQPYHLRLTQENEWSCLVILGATNNSTYIDGNLITGDTTITENQQLRVGDEIIPWQQ